MNKNLIIRRTHKFYASHRNYALVGDKCYNLHGHRYGVTLDIEVPPKCATTGVTILFSTLEDVINKIINNYDHAHLSSSGDPLLDYLVKFGESHVPLKLQIIRGEQTSAENIASQLYEEINNALSVLGAKLKTLSLRETDSAEVIIPSHIL
jgi:6-pyruvoyltetrahydropterin/6-carboxytetrahydropterin synthase